MRFFSLGDFLLLDAPEGVLAWKRDFAGDRRTVVVNFEDEVRAVSFAGRFRVEIASDGVGEGEDYTGEMAASQAVVLRPA